jgi:hypothetical protein
MVSLMKKKKQLGGGGGRRQEEEAEREKAGKCQEACLLKTEKADG